MTRAFLWAGFVLLVLAIPSVRGERAGAMPARASWGAPKGQSCIECHAGQNAALVEEWRLGAHGQ